MSVPPGAVTVMSPAAGLRFRPLREKDCVALTSPTTVGPKRGREEVVLCSRGVPAGCTVPIMVKLSKEKDAFEEEPVKVSTAFNWPSVTVAGMLAASSPVHSQLVLPKVPEPTVTPSIANHQSDT